MAIDLDKLLALDIPEARTTYSRRDVMFYALSIGMGSDPLDRAELRFVYEENLQVLPTMAAVLAHPGRWMEELDTGIDYLRVVHGEQSVTLHQPLPPEGDVVAKTSVVDVIDKGLDKGAIVVTRRVIRDRATDASLATVEQTTFCRGNGGFGGPVRHSPKPHDLPARAADHVLDLPTLPQLALLYRLNADMNPLHSDPDTALRAGYPRPILHGLATYGIAAHALLKGVCGYDAARLVSIACRFSAPVYPGESLRTEIWLDGDIASFRLSVAERGVIVASNGRAVITPSA